MPAAAAGGRGSAFFTGSGRRRASRSAVPRSTKTPSDGSRSTTPTSSSTGRRFSRPSRPPRPRLAEDVASRSPCEDRRGRRDRPRPAGEPVRRPRQPRKLEPEPVRTGTRPETDGTGTGTGTGTGPGTGTGTSAAQAFEQLTHPEAEEKIEPPADADRAAGRTRATDPFARALRGAAGSHRRARRRRRARSKRSEPRPSH